MYMFRPVRKLFVRLFLLPQPFFLPQNCEPLLAFPALPLRLLLQLPVSLSPFRRKKSRIAWLHRSSANSSAVAVWSPSGFLLALPLRAVLEEVLSSLGFVLAPSARGVRTSCCPLKIPAGEAVSHLELVEAGGEAFVDARHRGVRLLLLAGSVFAVL